MRGRSATDEDVGTVHLGVSGTSWPAAEKAGLVNAGGMWMLNAGGMWMTPEALQRMREWKGKRGEEAERDEETLQ